MERLEEAIELLKREENFQRDENLQNVLDLIIEASSHIRLGLVGIHESIKKDCNEIHNAVLSLEKIMGVITSEKTEPEE